MRWLLWGGHDHTACLGPLSGADELLLEDRIREHARFEAQVAVRRPELHGVDALNAILADLDVVRGELGLGCDFETALYEARIVT